MKSLGHTMLMKEAIKLFESQFPEYLIKEEYKKILIEEIVKPDTSDKNLKPLGSHYAIYDEKEDKFYNRIRTKHVNAYTLLCHYFDLAIKEEDINKSFINLGWALHFVMDMNTIPHAIGLTDATLLNFIRKPHKKYEIYTQIVIDKYFKKVYADKDFFDKDIFTIMKSNAELKNSFKKKMKKKYYDEINNTMIPIILEFTVGFLYKYFNERSKLNGKD